MDSHRAEARTKTLPGQVQLIDQRASDAVTALPGYLEPALADLDHGTGQGWLGN